MAEITFTNVTKVYPDGTCAVRSVDLGIPDGKLVVLVGPSGCGKTTLLRMVAGLEAITDGVLRIGDRVVNNLPPKDRDIAMVFQNYALYPHMSVYDNMGFGLKLRRAPKDEIDQRVTSTSQTLGLRDYLRKKPRHLSGGQRQRVAMGRAIVREPQVFLMDEPLSNLDAKLRVQVRAEIGRIQRALGVTMIYVTHDQTEAMTLGDLVAVMRLGVVQQLDTPQVLYTRPRNLFVAGFIGSPAMNLVEATLDEQQGVLYVSFAGHRLRVHDEAVARHPALRDYLQRSIVVGIRPEDMEDAANVPGAPPESRLRAAVELREDLGAEVYVHFSVDAPPVLTDDLQELAADTGADALQALQAAARERRSTFIARMNPRTAVQEGQEIDVHVDTRGLHFFDLERGEAIHDRSATA